VETFEQAGAAGILLEDQVAPKRCGHFAGKQVIPTEEMILKHKAAQHARSNPDFVIIARTDARAVHGLDDAIDRVRRYCDAGADVAFIEAPESVRELEIIAARVEYPLFVNMLTGGKTPLLSMAELEQMGYKIAVCPIDSLLIAGRAMQTLCRTLQTEGRVDTLQDQMMSFEEVKQVLGVERFLSLRDELENG
jgi:2-methylisocitrate lyase-like PEP mutase family enzyme